MKVTEKIAAFIQQTDYDILPREAVKVAKDAFLDCVGVALAGSREDAGAIITAYVRESGGREESGVVGGGFRCPSPQAALANGVMAHAMDYDDMHSAAHCHATAVMVPAILALGEKCHATGKQALAAYVVGLEVIYRLGHEFGMYLHPAGFHPTAISGAIGAAVASARMLGLDKESTQIALGIAASEAGGIRGNFGTMTKPFHAGNSARSGVVAALLAQKGFTADRATLDNEWGFVDVFGARADVNRERIVEGLGKVFHGFRGLEFKAYPSCGKTHAAIDAALHIVSEHHVAADQVTEIECATSDALPKVLIHHRPRNGLEGKFSLEYCVSRALVDGEVGVRHFTDEKVNEPVIRELIEKVTWIHPENMKGWGEEEFLTPEKVTVRMRSGESYSYQVERGVGELGQTMSAAQLEKKYRDCAAGTLKPDSIQDSLKLLRSLEQVTDLAELADLLCLTG